MNLTRREMIGLLAGMLLTKGCARRLTITETKPLDAKLIDCLRNPPSPGIACAIVKPGRVRWSGGIGMADLEHQRPMLADTLINVGSVSKTVTATAVMQLWEANQFDLHDDVGKFLPFPLRNPRFPEVPITFEQLLTHRSSINDGPSYDRSYGCGDPPIALGEWLKGYFTPGGAYWDEANWGPWSPGTVHPPAELNWYSNVGFGVLGYLVEILSQKPFSAFCKERIFDPLGMHQTGWFLREIDEARHATPYVRASDQMSAATVKLFQALTPSNIDLKSVRNGTLVPRCLYSWANYPDGSLRTSANELARFLAAYLAQGSAYGSRLLKPETLALIFSGGHFGRHLCWSERKLPDGRSIILHGGLDPGISACIAFVPSARIGAVCVRNIELNKEDIYRSMDLLLETAIKMD